MSELEVVVDRSHTAMLGKHTANAQDDVSAVITAQLHLHYLHSEQAPDQLRHCLVPEETEVCVTCRVKNIRTFIC